MADKTPTQSIFPLRSIEENVPAGLDRYAPMPTAQDIRDHKLFGIPLRSAFTNQEITDDTIDYYIKAATSELEHILDLYIVPTEFLEKHDYVRHDFTWSYNYMKVDHPNVLYVEKVELSFSNNETQPGFIDFPLEFVHVMPQEGVIQLVPAFGTATSGFLISAFDGAQFHALRATGMNNFPGGLRIKYVAGFDNDKIPTAIIEAIEAIAAVKILSILGPILFPQTSTSIGIDGTSQSVGTFGPKHFNDRILQLMAERDRTVDALKGYYQRRWLVDYF